MTKLYVIGNGFDLWHSLSTKYSDFYEFAKETLDDLEPYYYLDKNEDGLWSDFENSLGKFDWKLMYDTYDYTDITADNFKPSEAFGLEDELREQTDCHVQAVKDQFRSWIDGIDISVATKKLEFDIDDRFINFNYTSTLQSVYGVKDEHIFHIHGKSEAYDDLIFGHLETMKEEPELDENGDSNRTMFTDAENAAKYQFYAFQKPVNEIIKRNYDFFNNLSDIKNIIVIGHSLNEIDLPYFEEIARNTGGAKWVIYYRKQKDKATHVKKLLRCGIPKDKIIMSPCISK
jgi:abortive infection AbiH-like protein